jgi:rod shape-determining protein MreD
MVKNNFRIVFLILSSFLAAILLFILPITEHLRFFKPDWVTLVLIYWVVFLPNTIGIIFAFFLGLYMDLIIGNLLGTMGLTLSIVAYLTKLFSNRLVVFRFWQHSLIILILLGINQMLVLWLYIISGRQIGNFSYWFMSLTTVLIWPVVYHCLDYLRVRFRG